MKVLLCSPYSKNPQFVQGGIVVWAQNIVGYYHQQSTDVQLHVVPYDRKVRNGVSEGMLQRAWSGIADYREAIKQTLSRLKEEQYDVLHLCTSASISLAKDIVVLRMAKRKDVRTVVHFHFGRVPELSQQQNWEWKLLQKVVKLADVVVTMDKRSFTTLKGRGFNNIYYLPNPLSQSIINQIEQESASVEMVERKLSFVGQVIPTKGIYELVEACKGIANIKLHIFGKVFNNEVREKMQEIAANGDWLVFEGEVDHWQVIRELLSTDIFVLPTYTEGFPNVILESMACGCAIATTSVGAIPEMLDMASAEPCGLCCEPKDVEGLRRNIQYFLDHPFEARQYGERAVKRVNDMYAIQIIWERLVRIWKDCSEKAIKQEGSLC